MKKIVIAAIVALAPVVAFAQSAPEFQASTKTFSQYLAEGYEMRFQSLDGGMIALQKGSKVAFCQLARMTAFGNGGAKVEEVKTAKCIETVK